MNLEREIKLAVPAGFRLPESYLGGVVARSVDTQRYATVYFDTPDLRLVRWDCSLRHREGQGWTLKLPADRSSDVLTRRELEFAGEPPRPPTEAVDLIRAFVRTADLSPVARLGTHRAIVELETEDGKPLATITEDAVSVMDGSRVTSRFRELELELAPNASVEILAPLVAVLRAAGAGPVDNIPKLARVLGPLAQESEIALPQLGPDSTIRDLVCSALGRSVIRLFRHDPGVRLGDDPADVHQARVATRRLRSDLRSFRAELDPTWAAPLQEELRWIGGELGAVRDAEVLRDRLRAHSAVLPERDRSSAEGFVARMEAARAVARDGLMIAMRHPRYLTLLDRLIEATGSPGVLDEVALLPATQTLGRLVKGPWSQLRSAIERAVADPTDPVLLHAARIRAKRVRYTSEALAPIFGDVAQRFAAAAGKLQDVLGEHQDAVTAADWLSAEASSSGATGALAAGELAVLEAKAAAAARAEWPAAWKALADKRLRFWN